MQKLFIVENRSDQIELNSFLIKNEGATIISVTPFTQVVSAASAGKDGRCGAFVVIEY